MFKKEFKQQKSIPRIFWYTKHVCTVSNIILMGSYWLRKADIYSVTFWNYMYNFHLTNYSWEQKL